MPTTTPFALRYPAGTEFVKDGATAIQHLAEDVKALPWATSGLLSARPTSSGGTPGVFGREYYATDEGCLYFDYGTGWLEKGWLLTPAVRVKHAGGGTSCGSGSPQLLPADTETYDQVFTHHDTVTNNGRLVCKKAGLYRIGGTIYWSSFFTAGTVCSILLCLNGATGGILETADSPGSSSSIVRQTVVTEYRLALNDYVELAARHGDTGSKLASIGDFHMSRIGA